MLINHVGQFVELVAGLDVVGSPPAALEERHVLVELVVLAGIDLCVGLIERSSSCTGRQRQSGRQRIARSTGLGSAVRIHAYAVRLPIKVYSCGRPAKVVIVVEEVAEAGGGDDFRGQGDIGADVVSRIRGRETETVRILSDRAVNERVQIIRIGCQGRNWIGSRQADAVRALVLV